MLVNSHKTSGLKVYYFKHTAYTSCLLALGLIFLSIGFPRVTHCTSRLAKRSNISVAVLMFPYEIRLSRKWHQGSMLRRRQRRLMDEPQGRGLSSTHCKQGGMTSNLPRWGKTGLLLFPSKPLWVSESARGKRYIPG